MPDIEVVCQRNGEYSGICLGVCDHTCALRSYWWHMQRPVNAAAHQSVSCKIFGNMQRRSMPKLIVSLPGAKGTAGPQSTQDFRRNTEVALEAAKRSHTAQHCSTKAGGPAKFHVACTLVVIADGCNSTSKMKRMGQNGH